MKASLLGIPLSILVVLTAACSGSDQNGGTTGGKGGEGGTDTGGSNTGAGTTTGTDTGTGTGNNGGGGSTGTTTGTGNNGGGGSGAGEPCGGIAGTPCGDTAYCDYPDDSCGADDGGGTCTPKPEGCSDIYDPVCACDGNVYSNACDAAAAGQDLSLLGACPAPEGTFPCGSEFCVKGQEYCEIQGSDVAGVPNGYSCEELPPACNLPGATCACLSDLPCGEDCELVDGAFTLLCPGG